MATFKRATIKTNNTDNAEILINVDQVAYMRRTPSGFTSVHFSDQFSVVVEETPEVIAMLAAVEPH